MLEPVMFTGGLYKHDMIIELVEDLGGYILQKNLTQNEVILLILLPSEDLKTLTDLGKELRGEIVRSPLAGTEVAVVTPTLAIHHLPHVACDIAEYLRRHGAKSNMIGLARGVGREIAQINEYEVDLINEHDAALFVMGNFISCIQHKQAMLRNITIPTVITGGPAIPPEKLPYAFDYVESVGRVAHRSKKANEIGNLDKIVNSIGRALDKMRVDIEMDPLTTSPPRIMDAVREQVPEIQTSYSPLPIPLNLNGCRIKLPYDEFHQKVAQVKFDEGVKLGEIAHIKPSRMKNYILVRIKPMSETGFVF